LDSKAFEEFSTNSHFQVDIWAGGYQILMLSPVALINF